jgi:hypothetical protein
MAGTAFLIGFLNGQKGSLPWQTFSTPILDHTYDFELRWAPQGYGVFSMSDEDGPIVTERPIRYGVDLLADVQWDPRVKGLHIIPVADQEGVITITEENILDDVMLAVVADTSHPQLASIPEDSMFVFTTS